MTREELQSLYARVRAFTENLCEPLETEDYVVQTMPDVSPTKWHLAHTSWFFETFVLRPGSPGCIPFDEQCSHLFNSYYRGIGEPYPRAQRGLLARPTVARILQYREHVDREMSRFFREAPASRFNELAFAVELGVNHEEQHQELILTDIKHVLAANAPPPAYRPAPDPVAVPETPARWLAFPGGLVETGASEEVFAFDNERPRHAVHLEAFELASRLVTCGEYLEFVRDGGYDRPELWLADGWEARGRNGWNSPLYWDVESSTNLFSLSGEKKLIASEPVCHVSYYEADAYARWAGARLPFEQEWEQAALASPIEGNFVEGMLLHPAALESCRWEPDRPFQIFGDVWEWTSSPHVAYPGFHAFQGTLGEYNGKFMCNQMVLRGGSCATSVRHIRPTYRNFFPPEARWQFTGIRLARSEVEATRTRRFRTWPVTSCTTRIPES